MIKRFVELFNSFSSLTIFIKSSIIDSFPTYASVSKKTELESKLCERNTFQMPSKIFSIKETRYCNTVSNDFIYLNHRIPESVTQFSRPATNFIKKVLHCGRFGVFLGILRNFSKQLSETYSQLSRSKMELFAKIVNVFSLLLQKFYLRPSTGFGSDAELTDCFRKSFLQNKC